MEIREVATPLVSIVIPCYNAGRTLLASVQSALEQDYARLEVIVVDDGSTDSFTLSQLEALPNDVTLIRQSNAGLPAARNSGIRAAMGEVILPLDADDLIDRPYVAEAVQVLVERPEVGIVYCHASLFGEREGEWDLPPYSIEQILIENCIFCSALFWRRDWETLGGYNEGMRRGREDHEYWLRIIGLGRAVHQLEGRYFHYRISRGSMNSSYTRDEYIDIYAKIFRANFELYLSNVEAVMAHRFRQHDELMHWKLRYGRLELAIQRHSRLYKRLGQVYRGLTYRRRVSRAGELDVDA